MRERLTTLDWQREMLAEAGMGEAPLPIVQSGAFARPTQARHTRRHERHARVAVPLALDARLEAGLVATCVTMMALAPGFVRDELVDMANHPGWTAFFLFGFPILFHWLGAWAMTVLMLWLAYDVAVYVRWLMQPQAEDTLPPLAIDVGPGASHRTHMLGTFFAALAAELMIDALLMATGTFVPGLF